MEEVNKIWNEELEMHSDEEEKAIAKHPGALKIMDKRKLRCQEMSSSSIDLTESDEDNMWLTSSEQEAQKIERAMKTLAGIRERSKESTL